MVSHVMLYNMLCCVILHVILCYITCYVVFLYNSYVMLCSQLFYVI